MKKTSAELTQTAKRNGGNLPFSRLARTIRGGDGIESHGSDAMPAWSDGKSLTAKDVEFTYQTVINPSVPVRSRSGFDLIKNFEVVDDQNLQMELSKPYVPFMWAWQNMHIVPQHLLKDEKDLKTSARRTASR